VSFFTSIAFTRIKGLAVFCTAPTLIDCLIFKDRSHCLLKPLFKIYSPKKVNFAKKKIVDHLFHFVNPTGLLNKPVKLQIEPPTGLAMNYFISCEEEDCKRICPRLQAKAKINAYATSIESIVTS
jgi:hypothetical protein